MPLYDHQQVTHSDIFTEWNRGHRNILVVMPTGSGKTMLFTKVQQDFNDGYTLAMAHRQELVAQISHALAKWRIPHRIFAPAKVIRLCVARHTRDPNIRRSFHNTRAPHAVAAVDTLLRRAHRPEIADFLKRTRLQIPDEAHHVLHDPVNKWGRAYDLVPDALCLGVTATAIRADGNGLGRRSNGVFDVIVQGVKMRWLIENGYLKKYRIFNATPRHTSLEQKDISTRTGDYKRASLERDARENHIVGDVIQTYVKHAKGKRGITFAPSVEIAQEIAHNYCEAGVPAMCVSDKTSDEARESAV